jgi:protocatechuate 4,5-dioxygenase alpha subunit
MGHQLDREHPIPDTYIFDGRLSRKGYRINKLCISLTSEATRSAFKADEDAYMSKYSLTEAEKELVRKRDFLGLIKAGGNIYMLLKLGAVTGNGLYHMGAQQRGETLQQFLATRNVSGAV